eukprot:TRINITY_DN10224_c0_g2_i1.p1 TRINITY_DN10224_c0_g2~~TRINITY_DN10224_c0_g2_i1.p1  ORF type:complete len:776 (+),score=197.31 TRINITY_DN10224_c0_g2_i1:173-2500(+)
MSRLLMTDLQTRLKRDLIDKLEKEKTSKELTFKPRINTWDFKDRDKDVASELHRKEERRLAKLALLRKQQAEEIAQSSPLSPTISPYSQSLQFDLPAHLRLYHINNRNSVHEDFDNDRKDAPRRQRVDLTYLYEDAENRRINRDLAYKRAIEEEEALRTARKVDNKSAEIISRKVQENIERMVELVKEGITRTNSNGEHNSNNESSGYEENYLRDGSDSNINNYDSGIYIQGTIKRAAIGEVLRAIDVFMEDPLNENSHFQVRREEETRALRKLCAHLRNGEMNNESTLNMNGEIDNDGLREPDDVDAQDLILFLSDMLRYIAGLDIGFDAEERGDTKIMNLFLDLKRTVRAYDNPPAYRRDPPPLTQEYTFKPSINKKSLELERARAEREALEESQNKPQQTPQDENQNQNTTPSQTRTPTPNGESPSQNRPQTPTQSQSQEKSRLKPPKKISKSSGEELSPNLERTQRLYKWQSKLNDRNREKREENDKEAMKQCTFTPRTNNPVEKPRPGRKTETLFNLSKKKKPIADNIDILDSLLAKELKHCTFTPNTEETRKSFEVLKTQSPDQIKGSTETIGRLRQAKQERDEWNEALARPSLPPPQALHAQPFRFEHSSRLKHTQSYNPPLLYVDIKLGPGRTGRIGIHRDDDPRILANNFATAFHLDPKLTQKLEDLLRQHVEALMAEPEANSPSDSMPRFSENSQGPEDGEGGVEGDVDEDYQTSRNIRRGYNARHKGGYQHDDEVENYDELSGDYDDDHYYEEDPRLHAKNLNM